MRVECRSVPANLNSLGSGRYSLLEECSIFPTPFCENQTDKIQENNFLSRKSDKNSQRCGNDSSVSNNVERTSVHMRRVQSDRSGLSNRYALRDNLVLSSVLPIQSCYLIKEKIGQGTWGSVHIAVERTSGLERAVKKVPKRFVSELFRFRSEIDILKNLDHPYITRLYETFEDYSNIYMIMELCQGGDLFDFLKVEQSVSEPRAACFMRQVLSAVAYCHEQKIAHSVLTSIQCFNDHSLYYNSVY